MICLTEQYGYKNPKTIDTIASFANALNNKSYSKTIQRGENKAFCFKIDYNENEDNPYRFETSYFVGIDWIVENKLPIYVNPKLDNNNQEVDYINMLFDVLKEPANYKHIDELCEIDFNKPSISIHQNQDLLTPFLLIQYINILKKIVQKGLKKSYYPKTKNLKARVKGKILIKQTIKKNHFQNKVFDSYCQYNEFGINSLENKVLKKALLFSVGAIQNLKGVDVSTVKNLINYIKPAFESVDSEVNIRLLRNSKPNKLYQEYEQALKFAKIILKKYGYNITKTTSSIIKTPPFWIDMSKLFELYVYTKLRERFTQHNEVVYHKKFNYLEPDYIVNSNDGSTKMVIDAKYKPRYKNGRISTEDIRQLSGYARLEKVCDFLNHDTDKIIDCLIVYSNQEEKRVDFKGDNFNLEKEKEYNKFYKIGIKLPVKNNVHD